MEKPHNDSETDNDGIDLEGQNPALANPPADAREISDEETVISSSTPKRPAHPLLFQATGDDVLVDFDGPKDPYHPLNWPFRKKAVATMLYGLTTCWVTFASAVFSAAVPHVTREFDVKTETAAAAISLVVFGFAVGPLLWAPLSELYGRKWVIFAPYFLCAVFSFATAVSKDIQTILITRFFTGFFGAAPITVTSGVMADIWPPAQRGLAVIAYGLTLIVGPMIGPLIGGAISQSYLGWRWTEYLTGIIMMAQFAVDVLVLEETYAPVLLKYKAQRLRQEGKNWALHAKHEEWNVSMKEMTEKYLFRPFQLLATPICLLLSSYTAFVYGMLYANLESFTIEFQEIRHWNQVTGALPFIALLIGIFFGAMINVANNKYYLKKIKANGGRPVPEARLPPMMIGGILFTGGMFIFAWTSSPRINFWPSIIGIVLTGFGFTSIFQSCLNYLVDTFTHYSASAVAANTFLRSMFAGAFPLFIIPMYRNMGVDWGSTVFACIAAVLIPVPFLFFKWGKKIRAMGEWSKHSV